QTLMDAGWYQSVGRAYAGGASQRPPYDPTLDALQPVLAGGLSSIFEAGGEFEVIRALQIAKEFNLHPVIAGGGEAWKDADRLKSVPVLLSLAFGEEPKDAPPPAKPGDEDEPVDSRKTGEAKRLFLEKVHNAKVLDTAGIEFAFSTRGSRDASDFMSSLRRAVKEGLSKATALKALTVAPAKIFGMSAKLGTLEVGKIANVTVLTGDFLDEKSKVKMLYIDGRKIDPSKGSIAPAPRFNFGEEE
ncbi:MAG TPA: amidohydrolase family protein, partial [Fimbriimonadaceae bacterium]|nr:amidohydrolase family protein [Fimbriimonadaceae bacterium]